jgi:plastocyanin
MKRKKIVLTAAAALLVVMGSFLINQETASAKESRIINIYGDWKGTEAVTRLEPNELLVGRGTTVVWSNMSQGEVKISFEKGLQCQKGTHAGLGWKLDARGCYITHYNIPSGGTTSAYFKAAGRYDYEVEYVGKNRKEKGFVEVGSTKEAGMIRIYGTWEGATSAARIEPKEIWVGTGTTIVWVNMSQSDLHVVFQKGEECKQGTSATLEWKVNAQGCYITNYAIPHGGTTSAHFKTPGRYDYEVEYVGKDQKEQGIIEVRED